MFHVIIRVLINSGAEYDGDVTELEGTVGEGPEGGKSACKRAITPGLPSLGLRLGPDEVTA